MFKLIVATAIVAAGLATPVFAADAVMCDDAHMMKAETAAKAAKGDKMTTAMKDVDAAKAAMKAGKMDDCKTSLEKVMKDTM
ncbi:hypothetical protein ABID16_003001 [Rhizobium aquaticum]|uniref:Pentapeptide MXKDX repeat protein n=1 Tax=Rhizobium aquaticum TaxID=1549636 RepID=A0ABV2J492_9HYPH